MWNYQWNYVGQQCVSCGNAFISIHCAFACDVCEFWKSDLTVQSNNRKKGK